MTQVLKDLGFAEVAKRRSKVRFKPPYQGLPKSTFPKRRCTVIYSLWLLKKPLLMQPALGTRLIRILCKSVVRS
jgi:hypothetical protein